MIHDNTPLRIFKISERTRVIASELILIGRESAANLARTCRSLEEPVLNGLCGELFYSTWPGSRPSGEIERFKCVWLPQFRIARLPKY